MKKAIVYNIFGLGHIHPTLPIVRALKDKNVDVTYFTSPARKQLVEDAGARFQNYGYDAYKASDFNPGKNFVLQTIPATVGLLPYLRAEFERIKPDFILYDSMAPWGLCLSHIYQVPAFCSVSTFALSPIDRIKTFKHHQVELDDVNRKAMTNLRHEHRLDLPLITALGAYNDCNLVYTSKGFNPDLTEMNQDAFHFIGPLKRSHLRPQRPHEKIIITMSFGTIAPEEDPTVIERYKALLNAFGEQRDFWLILSVGTEKNLKALGELPTNCSAHLHIPQQEVLSYTDVFINHGGMNSVNEAIMEGVPQLIIPHSNDQFVNAKRVHDLNLGMVLGKDEVNAPLLRQKILELLRDSRIKQELIIHQNEFKGTPGLQGVLDIIQTKVSL